MASSGKSHYAVLGVLRDASAEDIKRAYFEAAQRLHPDKNRLAGETEMFLEVQQAYEVLSNPKRRKQYDASLSEEEEAPPPVTWTAQYSRPSLVHLGEPQLLYALVQVAPRVPGQKAPAPPLNLCLVLDRSTSMRGEKLDMVKAAAIEIVRTLRPDDIFSLVAFSDRAEVVVPAGFHSEPARLQGRIQGMQAGGATEMYQGLATGLDEVLRSVDGNRLSHIILLTDGQTYGDEQSCMGLAEAASRQNVGISGFGIGTDWNDAFLDALAAKTGNTSTYIAKPQQIQRLLMDRFEALTSTFAEISLVDRTQDEGVALSYAFRLQPEGGAVALSENLQLGPVQQDTPLNILMEFLVEPFASRQEHVLLLEGTLKAALASRSAVPLPQRVRLERDATEEAQDSPPPPAILDALSRFTLYRLQERARQEADLQEYQEASRHLRSLAALLLTQGEKDLAKTALLEAEQTERMQALSGEGSKQIKYGTRTMLGAGAGRHP